MFERKSPPPWVWGLFGVLCFLGGCWLEKEKCEDALVYWAQDPRVADAVPLANGWHAGCARVRLDWDKFLPRVPVFVEAKHVLFLGKVETVGCNVEYDRLTWDLSELHRLVGFWLDLVVQDPPSWLTEGVRVPVAYLWEESARGVSWGEGGSFSVPVWLEWLPVVERGGRKVLQGLWAMPFWGWHWFRFSGGERMWELWGDLPSSGQCWVTREMEIPGSLLEPSPGTEGAEIRVSASSVSSLTSEGSFLARELLKNRGEPVAVLAYMWGERGFYRLGERRMRLPDGKYQGVWRLEWGVMAPSIYSLGRHVFAMVEVEVVGGKVVRWEDGLSFGGVKLPKLAYTASSLDRAGLFYGHPEGREFWDAVWCLKPDWWSGDCFFAPFPATTVSVEEASGVP